MQTIFSRPTATLWLHNATWKREWKKYNKQVRESIQ